MDLLNYLLLDNLLKNCFQDQPHGLLSTEGTCLYLGEKRKWKAALWSEVSDSTPTTRHVYETSVGRPHKSDGEGGGEEKNGGKNYPNDIQLRNSNTPQKTFKKRHLLGKITCP